MEVNTTEINPAELFQPLLPSCLEGRLDGQFESEVAQDFDPTSWEYYKNEILPEAIAGFVFGVLAFILFLLLLIWTIYKYCCCCGSARTACCFKGAKKSPPAPDALATPEDQFITTSSTPKPTDAPDQVTLAPPKSAESEAIDVFKGEIKEADEKPSRGTRILQYSILLFALLTFGLCLWGIPTSLLETNSQISAFWDLFTDIYQAQNATVMELDQLSQHLAVIENSATVISQDSGALIQVLGNIDATSSVVTDGLAAIDKVGQAAGTAEQALSGAVDSINEFVGTTLMDIENDYKSKTITFQVRGRVAAIAILLGLILVGAPLAAWLCWKMTYPIVAATVVAMLLFLVCFVLVIGAGVARSLIEFSNDGCLYAEEFAAVTVMKHIKNEKKKMWLHRAFTFYLNTTAPAEQLDSAFVEITGVDLSFVMNILQSSALGKFLGAVSSNVAGVVFNLLVQDDTAAAIQDLADEIQPTINTIKNIDALVSRNATYPLYYRGKELICCDAGHSAQLLFACWTVIGAITFALALLCTWRIISHQRKLDKEEKEAKAGEMDEVFITNNNKDEAINSETVTSDAV